MADRHAFTVHIWRNADAFDSLQDNRHIPGYRAPDFIGSEGHASLKLQMVNAERGDYFHLSFWPGKSAGGIRVGHRMAIRYGNLSQVMADLSANPKQFATSTDETDKGLEGRKADRTYRFSGPSYMAAWKFAKNLANDNETWSLKFNNCAQAVADCLTAAGAPLRPPYGTRFTPNRVEEWCRLLVAHYGGEVKDPRAGTLVVTPRP